MITIKEFSKKYDLGIIPVSYETLTFGKCVWDGLVFGKPQFQHSHMPDYIYNAFVSSGILSFEESEKLLNRNRATPFVDANMANINIEFEADTALVLGIGKTIGLNIETKVKRIEKFVFTDLRAKILSGLDRFEIHNNLETFKDKNGMTIKKA